MEGIILGKKVLRIDIGSPLAWSGRVLSILFGIILGPEDDNPQRALEHEGNRVFTLSDTEANLQLALRTLQNQTWNLPEFAENLLDPQLQIALSAFNGRDFNSIASHMLLATESMEIVEI